MLRLLPLVLAATLGGFLFGFDSGVINGTVESLQRAFRSDSVGAGFNVASMLLGCALGALLAGALADRHGRKPVLLDPVTRRPRQLVLVGAALAALSKKCAPPTDARARRELPLHNP
jgi:MFS family permease